MDIGNEFLHSDGNCMESVNIGVPLSVLRALLPVSALLHPREVHLGSSCLPMHIADVERGQLGCARVGAVPMQLERQVHVVSWIRMIRVTSGSED